jgi:hypothetical protein
MSYYQAAAHVVEAHPESPAPAAPPAPVSGPTGAAGHDGDPGPVEPPPAAGGRRRARVPAGAATGTPGGFVADDPATPENEAWEDA